MVRGIAVGLSVYLVTMFWVHLPLVHPWYILGFALMGSAMMGAMGIVAGIWTEKFRPAGGVSKFHHYAADVFIGRVLFYPFVAAALGIRYRASIRSFTS